MSNGKPLGKGALGAGYYTRLSGFTREEMGARGAQLEASGVGAGHRPVFEGA